MTLNLILSNDFDIVLQENARDGFTTTQNCKNEVTHFYLAAILDFTVTRVDRLNIFGCFFSVSHPSCVIQCPT